MRDARSMEVVRWARAIRDSLRVRARMATCAWTLTAASGVRSSCAADDANRRSAASAVRKRSNSRFMEVMSGSSSVGGCPTRMGRRSLGDRSTSCVADSFKASVARRKSPQFENEQHAERDQEQRDQVTA